jgi:hypothetical protein
LPKSFDQARHHSCIRTCSFHHGQPLGRATSRPRGELPRLDGFSKVALCSEQRPSGTIKFDREGSHRALVQPELPISVLFYDRGEQIYSLENQRRERSRPNLAFRLRHTTGIILHDAS